MKARLKSSCGFAQFNLETCETSQFRAHFFESVCTRTPEGVRGGQGSCPLPAGRTLDRVTNSAG